MKTWDEFKNESILRVPFENETKTDIMCPECGEPLYKDNTIVLTSNPPQYLYKCHKCNFVGYHWV